MEEDKPVSVKDMIKQFSRCTTLSSQPVLTSDIDHQTPGRFETCTTLSSQPVLTSDIDHHTPHSLETRQSNLKRDNQPQLPHRSEMTQAQVPMFGSTSTENASLKPSDVEKIKRKPSIPPKPTLKRPSFKAEEGFEKKTEEQKVFTISKPTSSTAINNARQQVPEDRSHIDSEEIKESHPTLSYCFTKENGTRITEFVTVTVIGVLPLEDYEKEGGKTIQMFPAAICDATRACIAKVYDSEKLTVIQPNAVLILKDFFLRDGGISITSKSTVYGTGDPPQIPFDIADKALYLLSGTKHTRGQLRGIADVEKFKCCTNGRCNTKKLIENKCPTCGRSFTEESSGNGFVGKILVKTDSGLNTFKIFKPQVEHLCKLLDCNIESTSLEFDIARKLPVDIKFQNNGEKITKISVETSGDVHRF